MTMTTQTPTFDSSSGSLFESNLARFLEPEMACLLHMTNEVVMKINLQTKEMYL